MRYLTLLLAAVIVSGCQSPKEEKTTGNQEKTVLDKDTVQHNDSSEVLVDEFKDEKTILIYFENERCGYTDTIGNRLTEAEFEIAGEFSEGFACALTRDGWILLDKNVKPVFKFSRFHPIAYTNRLSDIDEVVLISEGKLPVEFENGKFGFMDLKTKSAEGNFDEVSFFSEGLAPVRVGSLWGFVDRNIELKCKPTWARVYSFSDNRAFVSEDGIDFRIIDKSFTPVSNDKYKHVFRFKEGLTFVTRSDNYDNYFIIDTTGKVINKGPYEYIYNLGFENGEAEVSKDGKCIIIDKKGKKVRKNELGCQEGC